MKIFIKNYKIFCLIIMMIIYYPLYAQQNQSLHPKEQKEVLQTITQKSSSVSNLKAEFIQSRHMEIFIEPLVSEGYCYFEKPDKLRWELTKPYQSILIYNANSVGKFIVNDGKIKKLNLGTEDLMREILKQIISWMQGDFSQAAEIYDLKIYRSESYKLVLIPKSEELIKSIQSIEMVFKIDLKNISMVQINESADNYIKIEFINEQKNVSINPKIFDIETPLLNSKP